MYAQTYMFLGSFLIYLVVLGWVCKYEENVFILCTISILNVFDKWVYCN